MTKESNTCCPEQIAASELTARTEDANVHYVSRGVACAAGAQLAMWMLCSKNAPVQPAEGYLPAKTNDHRYSYVPQHCYQQQVHFSNPVTGQYSYMGCTLTRSQKDELFERWLHEYPRLPDAILEARDAAQVRTAAKAGKSQATATALPFHEAQCNKYRQRCWIALNRCAQQPSSSKSNNAKSVPRLPAWLGASKPGVTAGAGIPKQLQSQFRVDPYGNIVAKDAQPGSLCHWDVDHLFPRERGGGSLPGNLVATHWYAKRHVKLARLLPTIMIDKHGVNPLRCGVTEDKLQHLWDACNNLPSAWQHRTPPTQLLTTLLCTNWSKSYDPKQMFDHKTGLLHTTPPDQLFQMLFQQFQATETAVATTGQSSSSADFNNDYEEPASPRTATAVAKDACLSLGATKDSQQGPKYQQQSISIKSNNQVADNIEALGQTGSQPDMNPALGSTACALPAGAVYNGIRSVAQQCGISPKSCQSVGDRSVQTQNFVAAQNDLSAASNELLREEVARSQPTSPVKRPRARMLSATTQTSPTSIAQQQTDREAPIDDNRGNPLRHMQPADYPCDMLEGEEQNIHHQEARIQMQAQPSTCQASVPLGAFATTVYSPPQSPLVAMAPPRPRNPTAYPYITEAYDFTGAASAGSSTQVSGILQTASHDKHNAKQVDAAATAVCSVWGNDQDGSPAIAGGHFWLPESPEVPLNPVVNVAMDVFASCPRMPEPGPHTMTVHTPNPAVSSYSLLPLTCSSPKKGKKYKQTPTVCDASTGILPAQFGSPASIPATFDTTTKQETTVQVMARGIQTSTHQAINALHNPIQQISDAWVKHQHKRIEANRMELARYGNVSSMPLWPGGPVPLTNPYIGPGQPHPSLVTHLNHHQRVSQQTQPDASSPNAGYASVQGVVGGYVTDTTQTLHASSMAAFNANQPTTAHASAGPPHSQQLQQQTAHEFVPHVAAFQSAEQAQQMMLKLPAGIIGSDMAAVSRSHGALSDLSMPLQSPPAAVSANRMAATQNTVAFSHTKPAAGSTINEDVSGIVQAAKNGAASLLASSAAQSTATMPTQQAHQQQRQQGQGSSDMWSPSQGHSIASSTSAVASTPQTIAPVGSDRQDPLMHGNTSSAHPTAIDYNNGGHNNRNSSESKANDRFDEWINQQRQDVDDGLASEDHDVQYVPQWQVSQSDNLSTAANSPRGPQPHSMPASRSPNGSHKGSSGEYRRSQDSQTAPRDDQHAAPASDATNDTHAAVDSLQPRKMPFIINKKRNQQVISETDLPPPAFHRHGPERVGSGKFAQSGARLSKGAKKAIKGVVKQFANLNPFKGFNKPMPEQSLAIGILPTSLEVVTEEQESDIQDAEGNNSPTASPKKSSPSKSWFSRGLRGDDTSPTKAKETTESPDRHMSPAKRIVQATMDNMRGLVDKVRSPQKETGMSPVQSTPKEPESLLRADVSKQAFTIPAVQPGQQLQVMDVVDAVDDHDRPSQLMQTIRSRGTQSGRLKHVSSLSDRKSAASSAAS